MKELESFYNDGFGWTCRRCAAGAKAAETDAGGARSRLLTEGEAESRTPQFSVGGLARWADAARTTLECPRCGARETLKR